MTLEACFDLESQLSSVLLCFFLHLFSVAQQSESQDFCCLVQSEGVFGVMSVLVLADLLFHFLINFYKANFLIWLYSRDFEAKPARSFEVDPRSPLQEFLIYLDREHDFRRGFVYYLQKRVN